MLRLLALSSLVSAFGALAACESSSGDAGTSSTTAAETGETGDLLRPQAGDYLIEIVKKTGMCRTEEEMESWTLTMPLPAEDGAWELTEDYSGTDILRQAPYPCDLSGTAGLCSVDKSRDYGAEMMGIIANVTAKRSWEFNWTSETEFDGLVIVDLRCTGSSCTDLAPEYLVNEWPCLTQADFAGTLK